MNLRKLIQKIDDIKKTDKIYIYCMKKTLWKFITEYLTGLLKIKTDQISQQIY